MARTNEIPGGIIMSKKDLIVREAQNVISTYWDENIEKKKDHLEKVLNARYRKHFAKELIKLGKKLEKKGV